MFKRAVMIVGAVLGLLFFSILSGGGVAPAGADEIAIPSFGTGKTVVRLYTDYFCGPCANVEPQIEKTVTDLVKRNSISLILIDTPIHAPTPLYARYFLYALKANNDFEQVMRARNLLFQAAKEGIKEEGKLEEYLRRHEVRLTKFDTKPTFVSLNKYLLEDKIQSTPTCVVQDGSRKTSATGPDIPKLLDSIK